MSDVMIDVTKPDGTAGQIRADPALVQKALAKKWQVADVPVTKDDGTEGTIRADLIDKAVAKGWRLGHAPAAPAPDDLPDVPVEGAPDAAPGQWSVNLGSIDQPSYQAGVDQVQQARAAHEIALQRQREEHQAALEREFGVGLTTGQGLQNTVQTVGEGLGKAAMLGMDAPMAYAQAAAQYLTPNPNPDVPARTFGEEVNAAKAGIAGRQQTNPLTSGASDLAGTLLMTAGTGGTSLASRLAARTPTGFVGRKAAQLGLSAAGRLGLTGSALEAPGLVGALKRIAAPVVRLGAEGAAQGAVQGGVREANDAWLSGNADDVVGLIKAGGGGAWRGGLLGALIGAGAGMGLGLRNARSGAAAKERLIGQGLIAESPPTKLPPSEPAMAYSEPEPTGIMQGTVAKRLKLTPELAAEKRAAAYPRIRDKWNEFLDLNQRFNNELDIAAKKDFVRANALGEAPVDFGAVRQELGLDRASLEALAEHGAVKFDGKGGAGSVLRLASQLDALENDLFEQATRRQLTEGDVFIATDQMKRDTQRAIAQANRNNPFLFDVLDPKGQQILGFLEDDSVWSPALAKMQKETNAGWAKSIAARMDSDLGGMAASRGVKSQWNPYDLQEKVNDSWLNGHLNGIGAHPAEEQTAQAVNRWLNATSDDVLTRAQAYGGKQLTEAAEKMNDLRRELQRELGQVAKVNANTAPAGPSSLGVLGQVPGSSYVTQHALDAAREWAHKASAAGADAVDAAAELRGLIGKARPSLSSALVRGVPGGEKAAKAAGDYLKVALNGGQTEEEQNTLAVLEQAFGTDMAQAAAADMQRTREFLQQKAQTSDRLTLLRYADAALNPRDALERISTGVGTSEERETLQALQPVLWQRFVNKALENLSTKQTTYDDRLRASQALGITLDPSLLPERYAMHQQVASQQAMQVPQPQNPGASVLPPGRQREPRMGALMKE